MNKQKQFLAISSVIFAILGTALMFLFKEDENFISYAIGYVFLSGLLGSLILRVFRDRSQG